MTEEKKPRGFAALTPEHRRQISSMGGKAAQATGHGHKFTPEEARAAGAKGGRATHAKKKAEAEADMLGLDCAITENLEGLNGE